MRKYFLIIGRLWNILKPFHWDFYLQLFSTIVMQVITVGSTLVLAKTLDALIGKNIHLLVWMIILYPVCMLINNHILYYANLHSLKRIDNGIQQHLEEFSFKKIFALNVAQYREDHSAVKLQVISRGENAAESVISIIVLTLLPVVTQITFALIAISFYSIVVALWCFVTVVLVTWWSNYFANHHRPFVKQSMDNWDGQRKIRAEAFQHLSLIKLLAAEGHYLKKYLSHRFSILEYANFVGKRTIVHGTNRQIFMIMSRAGTFIIIILLYLKSLISVGVVYALWSWINDVYGNIQRIVQVVRNLPLRFAEVEKYLDIIDKQALFEEEGAQEFYKGDIVFDHVSFKYPYAETAVIVDLNLTIPRGKKTAFVGHSGSGKSTIVSLLLRIYDWDKGDISVGGISLRNMSATSLRKNIGYVEQHVDLFDDTIKENILLGTMDEKRSDAEKNLEDIAHKARIDQFYHRLGEEKFDTVLGERGIKLSGGERQRVGIARAIIKDPEILVFDEATSSLDTENEKYVMDAIREVSEGKTTIIIAHRLSTVRDADQIIVMDKGEIVGVGTHEELLATNLVYKNLIEHQMLT